MNENNELNDIILNKGTVPNNNKKIVLAVATLGIILIIVVMLMNSLTSNGTQNLPQAVLPPQPSKQEVVTQDEDPLFEEVELIEDNNTPNGDNLDKIAQKLKQESVKEEPTPEIITPDIIEEAPTHVAKKIVPKKTIAKVKKTSHKVINSSQAKYIQVGSFSKYEPNKKFLKSITSKGYKYKYHKVMRNSKTLNKVLVGPFYNDADTKKALRTIRSSIEAGAFIVKI